MAAPIFIIGAMGSGTTLLRLMLDSHERIAIPPETGFMRIVNAYRYTPFKFSGGETMERLGWSDADLDRELHDHFDRLFMHYAAQHGKVRWGEKSPLHTWHIEGMARLFPEAQFVMIVRHPAGSVHSNQRRFKRYIRQPLKPIWHWDAHNRLIVQAAEQLGERMVLLRYEDMVLQPEQAMRELLEWLGEPWSDAVLSHHTVQADRGGKVQVEGRTSVDNPIDVSRIDGWTRTMDAEMQERVAKRLGAFGRLYGYRPRSAEMEPLTPTGSLLLHARELAARIDEHPKLNLREPVKLPANDSLHDPRKFIVTENARLRGLQNEVRKLRAPKPKLKERPRLVAIEAVRKLPPGPRRKVIGAVRSVRGAK